MSGPGNRIPGELTRDCRTLIDLLSRARASSGYERECFLEEMSDVLMYGKLEPAQVSPILQELVDMLKSEQSREATEIILNDLSTAFVHVGDLDVSLDPIVPLLGRLDETLLEYGLHVLSLSQNPKYRPIIAGYLDDPRAAVRESARQELAEFPSSSEVWFKCETCGHGGDSLSKNKPAWARVAGFARCVEWLEEVRDQPRDSWQRLNEKPVVGKRYALRVRHPFRAVQREPFWTVFQPALSAENDWSDHPEELGSSCLVHCNLVELLSGEEQYAVIIIAALDVISFGEISGRFEKDHSGSPLGPFLDQLWGSGCTVRVSWEDLTYISLDFEGDAGAWAVCQITSDEPTVLLYGEWDWHADFVYAGNRPLTPAESRLFERGNDQTGGGAELCNSR